MRARDVSSVKEGELRKLSGSEMIAIAKATLLAKTMQWLFSVV